MALIDRDIYLRNHIVGVLVAFSGKGLSCSNMGELADSITEAVIEGDLRWKEESISEQFQEIMDSLEGFQR